MSKQHLLRAFVFMIILSYSASSEVKYYSRLGNLSEFSQIYMILGEEPPLFIDAESVPPEYRVRITNNPDNFRKIDMKKVLAGRKVSSKGTITYDKPYYAKNDSELYESKEGLVLDLQSVSEIAKNKIKTSKLFSKVKNPEIDESSRMALDQKYKDLIDEVVGPSSLQTDLYGSKEIAEAVIKYESSMEKVRYIVLDSISEVMMSYARNGDLENTEKYKLLKDDFNLNWDIEKVILAGSHTLKSDIKKYTQELTKQISSFNKVIESEKRRFLISGDLSMAKKVAAMFLSEKDFKVKTIHFKKEILEEKQAPQIVNVANPTPQFSRNIYIDSFNIKYGARIHDKDYQDMFLVKGHDDIPIIYESTFEAPAQTDLFIHIGYASNSSRPVEIKLDDEIIASNALSNITDGWNEEHTQWETLGPFNTAKLRNTLTFEPKKYSPHIKGIVISTNQQYDTRLQFTNVKSYQHVSSLVSHINAPLSKTDKKALVFDNKKFVLNDYPGELENSYFTYLPYGKPKNITFELTRNAYVYCRVDTYRDLHKERIKLLTDDQWYKLSGDMYYRKYFIAGKHTVPWIHPLSGTILFFR